MADIFTIAKAAYDDSINDLRKMTKFFERVNPKCNPRLILNRFDVMLQYSLLQIALVDGFLSVDECLFIKELPQYSDFCVFLEEQGFKDVTWEKIYNTRESFLNRVLDDAQDIMTDFAQEFVQIFAAGDFISSYDFLADLKKNVLAIVFATCKADGRVSEDELEAECLIIGTLHAIEEREKELAQELKSK